MFVHEKHSCLCPRAVNFLFRTFHLKSTNIIPKVFKTIILQFCVTFNIFRLQQYFWVAKKMYTNFWFIKKKKKKKKKKELNVKSKTAKVSVAGHIF